MIAADTPRPAISLSSTSGLRFRVPWVRWSWKTLGFVLFTLLLLNPNIKRGWLQVRHTLDPEALIQTRFSGLPAINAQIDRALAADAGRHSEPRLIARFVLKKITYVTDYENWGNVEYWPTAQEVWDKRQEDCDGRAVLATSILRARGYHSARMVIGLDHMWVRVNENETNPAKPPHYVSLLSPNSGLSLDLHETSRWEDFVAIAKALLHPGDFRDTLVGLFADIPALRKVLLVLALVWLCYHPCKDRPRLLALLATALAGVVLLASWQPDQHQSLRGTVGFILLSLAMCGALFLPQLRAWWSTDEAPDCALPELPQMG